MCHNSINALKFLANRQKDGDKPSQDGGTGLQERSGLKSVEALRSFIMADNHEDVKSW